MTTNTSSSKETIFFDGEKYYQALQHDIATAKKTIDLETYIFQSDRDSLGKKIIDSLILAAQRGVNIRILVDGAGSASWGGQLTKQLEKAGVKTRVFHPIPWRLWHWSRSVIRLPFLIKLIYFIFKINTRNHRKVCIIDKKIVYVGSANISICHLNKEQGGENWRDTVVRLLHANITDLQQAFNAAWKHVPIQGRIHGMFKHIADTNPRFRLNNTRHRRRVLHKNLLQRLAECKKRVWITNAYFVPDNFLLKKLNDLARSGIDVRILLPQKSDIFIMPWASYAFYESLLKSGVRIFEYLPSILHAKTLILDDWFIVGSSNMNHRSLLHDLEVDVSIQSKTCKHALVEQFLYDLTQAKEVHLQNWHKRALFQRIIGRLMLYIKYWI